MVATSITLDNSTSGSLLKSSGSSSSIAGNGNSNSRNVNDHNNSNLYKQLRTSTGSVTNPVHPRRSIFQDRQCPTPPGPLILLSAAIPEAARALMSICICGGVSLNVGLSNATQRLLRAIRYCIMAWMELRRRRMDDGGGRRRLIGRRIVIPIGLVAGVAKKKRRCTTKRKSKY